MIRISEKRTIGTYNCCRHPRQTAQKAGSRRSECVVALGDGLKQDNVHNWTLKNRIPTARETNASGRLLKINQQNQLQEPAIAFELKPAEVVHKTFSHVFSHTCTYQTSVTNLQYRIHTPTHVHNLGMKSTSTTKAHGM